MSLGQHASQVAHECQIAGLALHRTFQQLRRPRCVGGGLRQERGGQVVERLGVVGRGANLVLEPGKPRPPVALQCLKRRILHRAFLDPLWSPQVDVVLHVAVLVWHSHPLRPPPALEHMPPAIELLVPLFVGLDLLAPPPSLRRPLGLVVLAALIPAVLVVLVEFRVHHGSVPSCRRLSGHFIERATLQPFQMRPTIMLGAQDALLQRAAPHTRHQQHADRQHKRGRTRPAFMRSVTCSSSTVGALPSFSIA